MIYSEILRGRNGLRSIERQRPACGSRKKNISTDSGFLWGGGAGVEKR